MGVREARSSGLREVGKRVSSGLDRYIFLLLCLLAAIIFWQYGPLEKPVKGDPGYFIYISQEIGRGGVPYLSFFDNKTPLTGLLGGLAIIIGSIFEVPDLFAIRFASLFLGAMAIGLTYLVVKGLFEHRVLGLIAALVMASFSFFGQHVAGGGQPKMIMVFMGLLTLYSIQEGVWWLAGLAGSLAFLAWQPGAIYAFLALAAPFLLSQKGRRSHFVQAFLGVMIPLALIVLYLGCHGALYDAIEQCVIFPLAMVPRKAPAGLTSGLARIARGLSRFYGREIWFIALGLAGLLARLIYWGWAWARDPSSVKVRGEALFHLSWLAFVFLSLVSFQGGPDFIPLLPYVATGMAWMAWIGATLLSKGLVRLQRTGAALCAQRAFLGLALIWVAIYGMGDIRPPKRGFDLERQRALVEEVTRGLSPTDGVLAIGVPEILVLSGRENASKYIYFHGGVDEFIDAHEEGGFSAFLKDLRERKPKVVALARLQKSPHVQELLQWVEEDYYLYFQRGKFKVNDEGQYEYDKKTRRIYIRNDKVD